MELENMETLTPAAQLNQSLELLEAQRESLLSQLETLEPGSTEFAEIAARLVQLKADLETQATALKAQQQLDKSEAELQAEAEQARQAEAEAATRALTAAKLERDELLEAWASLAAQLKAAIVAWNEFAATDQAALLREQREYPTTAGVTYDARNWDRRVPYPKQRRDGHWTLFMQRDDER